MPTPWATVQGFLRGLKWKWSELPGLTARDGVLPSGVGIEGVLVGLRGRRSLEAVTSWLKSLPWAGLRAGGSRADGGVCVCSPAR